METMKQHILRAIITAMVLDVGFGCDETKPPPTEPTPAVSETTPPPEAPPAPEPAKLEPTPIVNTMILIPGGTFTMGSADGDPNERPPHQVRVPSFEMDVHEVTLRSYMACINEQKCSYPDRDSLCNWGKDSRMDDPINCVEWEQARNYCETVGKRLPTETEWEYAAKGTDGRVYGWGDGDLPEGICFNRARRGTCRVDTVPVDSAFGLRGMAGNVWEWTSDGFSSEYRKPRDKAKKVYRGASFLETDKADLRASVRNTRPPNVRMDYLGFRCARTPKAK